MMLPLCHNWPKEFSSDFTNGGEYYSLQTVLGSGSSVNPFPHPEGQGMNSLHAIGWCHYATIGPTNLFPILRMRRGSFKPFRRPAGHSRNSLYAIRRCHHLKIAPTNFFPILHMRLNITACRLF